MVNNKQKVIDILNKYNCQFLNASTEIVRDDTIITYKNSCGHEIQIKYISFQNYEYKPTCSDCSNIAKRIDDNTIKQLVIKKDCELVNIEHKNGVTFIEYKGQCGCIVKERLSNFKKKKHNNCSKHRQIDTSEKLEIVIKYFKDHGCELLSKEYINDKQKLEYIAKCGHKHQNTFNDFKRVINKSCSKCHGHIIENIESVTELFFKRGCILITDNYINAAQELEYIAKCGHKSFVSLSNFKRYVGLYCKECRKSKSTGEKIISDYLKNNNIKFIEEKIFKDCVYKKELRFDFYLPEKNLVIEFDGNHHFDYNKKYDDINKTNKYKLIFHKDMIKNRYCLNKNIKILRISYSNMKDLKNILDDNIHPFPY